MWLFSVVCDDDFWSEVDDRVGGGHRWISVEIRSFDVRVACCLQRVEIFLVERIFLPLY